jgi:hypothetical protein
MPGCRRAARNPPEADRLRAEIEAAGWRIVDTGTDFALAGRRADCRGGGLVRFGSFGGAVATDQATGLAT